MFAAYFDQWEGEAGHQLWLRNVIGLDEQDTTRVAEALGDFLR